MHEQRGLPRSPHRLDAMQRHVLAFARGQIVGMDGGKRGGQADGEQQGHATSLVWNGPPA